MIFSVVDRMRPWIAWSSALLALAVIVFFSSNALPRAASVRPTEFVIHADRPTGAISPYIYGMAQPSPQHFAQLRLKLWRWGGNPASRYNWEKGNCWNAAADWEFRNGNYDNRAPADRLPSGVADKAIAAGKAAGSDVLVTIPTLGWVARDDNNSTASVGVPPAGGPPLAPGSEAIAGYDPAENRKLVSQRSLPRKGAPLSDPPNLTDDVVYQDEWVHHLTIRFGKARTGGVRFYAMDNEPDLWSVTHRDMRPVRQGYDGLLKQFLEYADAVKDVDPGAQVTGPVSWGWTGYLYSPLDQGADNYATAADRKAHDGLPFLAWFLREVAAHDRRTGRRTLDILDVHFYPQSNGVYKGASDNKTDALRLRSTRALWDPSYTDESWIATQVELLPRLRKWIAMYYPGTGIGLTEWNWGADNTLNGGIAVAEVLGILGRERIDLACYWTAPTMGSPGFRAWQMYRNADGNGHGFGDVSVPVEGGDLDGAVCFASIDGRTGYPILMILNKSPRSGSMASLSIMGKPGLNSAERFQYSGADLKSIVRLPNITIKDGKAVVEVPPYSMTLLRCR